MNKYIDICVFYTTARNHFTDLEQNPELQICYNCRGYNVNCSKQLLIKIPTQELRGIEKVVKVF